MRLAELETRAQGQRPPYFFALIHAGLGETDREDQAQLGHGLVVGASEIVTMSLCCSPTIRKQVPPRGGAQVSA